MNKTILKNLKYIKSEAFREYSHLQGYSLEDVNTHEKLRF